MEKFLMAGKWILANYDVILMGVTGSLTGVIAIAMVIPGDQPEKTLQKIVDFLSKFSKKPAVIEVEKK